MRAEFERIQTSLRSSWSYRVLRRSTFQYHWHLHTEHELTLITRGSGTLVIGDHIESYRPGELTLIGSGVPHAYVSMPGSKGQEAIVIQFNHDFLGADFFSRPEFAPVGDLLNASSAATRFETTDDLVRRCRALRDPEPTKRTLELVSLLTTLASDDQATSLGGNHDPYRGLGMAACQRIDEICAYLQGSFTDEVRLSAVAEVAHLSPAATSRFFRQAIGRTITEYVTELRIMAARQLLRDSDLTIAAIASRCGYGNLSNFNRRFRILEGRSPGEYRRAADRVRPSTRALGRVSSA